MADELKIEISLDDDWHIVLRMQCPLCGAWQAKSAGISRTGTEFVCECGEDIRVTADGLGMVRNELDELKRLIDLLNKNLRIEL